jgi:hypothetical protein
MDAGRGAMRASFAVDYNGYTCESAGIDSIRVVLDDGLSSYEATAPCTDYEIEIENVPSNIYAVTIYGLNEEGVAIADSLNYDGIYVEILANDTAEPSIRTIKLDQAAVPIWARWAVGFYTCSTLDIESFSIEVMEPGNNTPILKSSLKCNAEGTEQGQFRIVPDKKKELSKHEFNQIVVKALKKNGKPRGESFVTSFNIVDDPGEGEVMNPGPGGVIALSLRCDASGCYNTFQCN